MYFKRDKISFLTDKENEVMQHLVSAYMIFEEIVNADQQCTSDLFDFGHYLDAAQNSILVRGARRLDPDLLLGKDEHRDVKTN